jgi:hypothetical protein
VVRLGAAAATVEVAIEIDPHSQRVRATATGASEMRTRVRTTIVGEDEARAIAARSMEVPVEATHVAASTDRLHVIQASGAGKRRPVRAVDLEGTIRLQRSDAVVVKTLAREGAEAVRRVRAGMAVNGGDAVVPDMLLIAGAHIAELAGALPPDQAAALAHTELEGLAPDASVILIATAGVRR